MTVVVKNYAGEDVVVPEEPIFYRGGCTCSCYPGYGCDVLAGEPVWVIHPECGYHQAAARQPWNHTNPWACGYYYDGCNHRGGPYFPEGSTIERMTPEEIDVRNGVIGE